MKTFWKLGTWALLALLGATATSGAGTAGGGRSAPGAAAVSGAAIGSVPLAAPRAAEDPAMARLREAVSHGAPYIVGGEVVMRRGAWPFATAFIREVNGRFYHYCGGSLIADNWVLTAAHCKAQIGDYVVIARHDLRSREGVVTLVERVVAHRAYDATTDDNDIALVRIGAPGAPSIPHAALGAPPAAGKAVTAIGWGAVAVGGVSTAELRQVTVDVVGEKTCAGDYAGIKRPITGNMLCAARAGKDSCQGDSGGPLLSAAAGGGWTQVGIVSFGMGCGLQGFPGVYTRLDQYLKWVEDNARG
jgi:secreted trypsin-like serine protease